MIGSTSKRITDADLGPEQIQTRIRIGLSPVGEMFVLHADVDLPMIVQLVSDACAGENVEREILPLRSAHVRIAVDPAETESAGKIWHDARIRTHEIVTAAEIHAVVKIFHAANDRLRHQR